MSLTAKFNRILLAATMLAAAPFAASAQNKPAAKPEPAGTLKVELFSNDLCIISSPQSYNKTTLTPTGQVVSELNGRIVAAYMHPNGQYTFETATGVPDKDMTDVFTNRIREMREKCQEERDKHANPQQRPVFTGTTTLYPGTKSCVFTNRAGAVNIVTPERVRIELPLNGENVVVSIRDTGGITVPGGQEFDYQARQIIQLLAKRHRVQCSQLLANAPGRK